jgi:hypothetical protein
MNSDTWPGSDVGCVRVSIGVDVSVSRLASALRAHPMVLGTQQQQSRQITSFSTGADRAAAWVTCARTSQKGRLASAQAHVQAAR